MTLPVSAPYVHLHVHSEYSILDGACRIPDLVTRAADLGMPAVTLTDHGSMAGAIQLFAWGFAVGRKAYAALWAAIAAGIADGLLGLGLVWLEITVVHH